MARLPYPDVTEIPGLEAVHALSASLNVWRMAAHAPELVVPGIDLSLALLRETQLDPALRELVILAVGRCTGATYIWVQHQRLAAAVGLTDEQIAGVDRDDACFDERQRAALDVVRPVLADSVVTPDQFARLTAVFTPREIVELLLVIGYYQMMSKVMTALQVDIDPAGEAIANFLTSS